MMLITLDLNYQKDYHITEHFKASEFQCPHCKIVKIDSVLVEKLETLRQKLGNIPLKITSGYRCPSYNKQIGGYYKSRHLISDAVDVRPVKKDIIPYTFLVEEAIKIFSRVGVYPERFIHVDLYGQSKSRFWFRTSRGKYIYTNDFDYLMSIASKYSEGAIV